MLEHAWTWWVTVALPVVLSVIVVARIVVKLTPSQKDDTFLASIVDFLKHIGLHIDDNQPPQP